MGFQNLDSFRVYEALECGCIPIVERRPGFDYFRRLLGPYPFISTTNWHDAGIQVARLLAEPALLEARRFECEEWWRDLKHRLSERMAQICDGSQEHSKVSKFCTMPLLARLELLRHAPSMTAHVAHALKRRAVG
jgi:hypothetical protein